MYHSESLKKSPFLMPVQITPTLRGNGLLKRNIIYYTLLCQ